MIRSRCSDAHPFRFAFASLLEGGLTCSFRFTFDSLSLHFRFAGRVCERFGRPLYTAVLPRLIQSIAHMRSIPNWLLINRSGTCLCNSFDFRTSPIFVELRSRSDGLLHQGAGPPFRMYTCRCPAELMRWVWTNQRVACGRTALRHVLMFLAAFAVLYQDGER